MGTGQGRAEEPAPGKAEGLGWEGVEAQLQCGVVKGLLSSSFLSPSQVC